MNMNCRRFRELERRVNFSMAQHARLESIRGQSYHFSILGSVNAENIIRAMKAGEL